MDINFVDIIIIILLATAVFLAIRSVVKNKKKGGCASCAECHRKDCCQETK